MPINLHIYGADDLLEAAYKQVFFSARLFPHHLQTLICLL